MLFGIAEAARAALEALLHAQNRSHFTVGNILTSLHPGYPAWCNLYAVGERSLFHTLCNAPSVMGRAPAKRKTTSPTMRRDVYKRQGPWLDLRAHSNE